MRKNPLRAMTKMTKQISVSLKELHACSIGKGSSKNTIGINILAQTALQGHPVIWFTPTFNLSEHNQRVNLITGDKCDSGNQDNEAMIDVRYEIGLT